MMAGDERLSKDLESVKSAEDFTNALNAYSDKVDVFISKTATFDKAAYDNMDKKLEQAKVPMTMTEEDGKAMNIAIANLGLKFNTSPKVVKAYTRYVRALSKLMELAKRRDQLQK